MNVLIVDDQVNVVSSLKTGVNWQELQIKNIYTALNAFEAKEIILTHPIDILLSDIEMPVENGLSLLRWCRQNNYTFECIFLTSHADFFYAQEAIQLGSFDYILQPARYEDIEKAIKRSILRIEESRKKKLYIDYGKVAFSQKNVFLKGILHDWFTGKESDSSRILDSLGEMDIHLELDSQVYLFWVQILNWTSHPLTFSDWSTRAEEIIQNIFTHSRYHMLAYCPDKVSMAVLVYTDGEEQMSFDVYQTRLTMVYAQISRRLLCSCAVYTVSSTTVKDFCSCAQSIRQERKENVLLNPGIFITSAQRTAQSITSCDIEQLNRFELYMANHQAAHAQQEALSYLRKLNHKHLLNHDSLLAFCRDYQQAAYSAAKQLNLFAHSLPAFEGLLQKNEGNPLTLEFVSTYIQSLTDFFNDALSEVPEDKGCLAKVEQYIMNNLDKPLLCTDIAKAVYLSPDYITRIFQKEKGMSLKEYITLIKMNTAKSLLITTSLPVSIIAAKVGYDNFSHFS